MRSANAVPDSSAPRECQLARCPAVTVSVVPRDPPRRVLGTTKTYYCKVTLQHCSNLGEFDKIMYLSDTNVVVVRDVDDSNPIYRFTPIAFEVVKCASDTRDRYKVRVDTE